MKMKQLIKDDREERWAAMLSDVMGSTWTHRHRTLANIGHNGCINVMKTWMGRIFVRFIAAPSVFKISLKHFFSIHTHLTLAQIYEVGDSCRYCTSWLTPYCLTSGGKSTNVHSFTFSNLSLPLCFIICFYLSWLSFPARAMPALGQISSLCNFPPV